MQLSTPALVLDLDRLEENVGIAGAMARMAGVQLRPHAKSHKCVAIAKILGTSGAIGASVATLAEAEAFASGDIGGLLVTAPQPTEEQLARAVRLASKTDLLLVADSRQVVERLSALAVEAGIRIGILVDCNVGQNRSGVDGAQQALALARCIAGLPGLSYRGVQAYWGHLQQLAPFTRRKMEVEAQAQRLRSIVAALREAGLRPEIVTGGGTGTLSIDLGLGLFTELQPGSFLFLDSCYGSVAILPEGQNPFRHSLFVRAAVTSAVSHDRIIVNAGLKAFATDSGRPIVARGAPDATSYEFMGDEHGRLSMPEGSSLSLGSEVEFIPSHCDPTVNLYSHYNLYRQGRHVGTWPIVARGYGDER